MRAVLRRGGGRNREDEEAQEGIRIGICSISKSSASEPVYRIGKRAMEDRVIVRSSVVLV